MILSSNLYFIKTTSGPITENENLIPQNNDEKIKQNLANLKGFFTKNQGQLENEEIYFTYTSKNINFAFLESSVLVKISKSLDENTTQSSTFKIIFENSNKVIPKGQEELEHKSNYFIGNDSSKWKSNVLNYEKVVYKNLYDGIDLVYYFNEKGLKYDWVVKVEGEPSEIVERFEGIDSIEKDNDGGLIIKNEAGELMEEKPYSYQEIFGDFVEVDVCFNVISENRVTYEIGDYDSSNDLIIDPLIYSIVIGGNGTEGLYGGKIALDNENNVYTVGTTWSSNFPTTPECFNESYNGDGDVYIFKLNNDGSTLVFSTFIGGKKIDWGYDLVLDPLSYIYVTGHTSSSDFPITIGCYDVSHNGENDIFVSKLGKDGKKLIYSTFVGGEDGDFSHSITLDSDNNTYITGRTWSHDFPTTLHSYDISYNDHNDVFVFKLNFDGSKMLYSTFVGGSEYDVGFCIEVDSEKNAYITGRTKSSDFPITIGCFDNSHNGNFDVFVFKLNKEGSDLIYSTYIGGGEWDEGNGIALDSKNNIYIVGCTNSKNFPITSNCYDDSYNDWGNDVFVFKMNSDGSDLSYSTFIGTGIGDSIMLDSEKNAYITGGTRSSNFPTTPDCFYNTSYGVFVFKLNSNGSNLLYSTYIGGGSGKDIALDSENNLYVVGCTSSIDFPITPGSFNDSYNSNNLSDDVFVFKLNINIKPILKFISLSDSEMIDNTTKILIIKGVASVSEGKITKVQLKIDYGEWQNVSGTNNWTYEWNLSNLKLGEHHISIRAFDESSLLKIITIKVNIIEEEKNEEEKNQIEIFIFIIAFFILLLLVFTVNIWYSTIVKRKREIMKVNEEKKAKDEIK